MSSRVRLLLVGTPRSGTTLAARLLAERGIARFGPETHFLHLFRVTHPSIPFERPLTGAEAEEAISRYSEDNNSVWTQELARQLGSAEGMSALEIFDYLADATAPGAGLLGEKTPRHLKNASDFLVSRQDAVVAVIIRDPRAVCASLMHVAWAGDEIERHADRWVKETATARELQQRFGERVPLIKYEDMLRSPGDFAETVRQALAVAPTETARVADITGIIQEWEVAWKGKALEPVDSSRIDAFRSDLEPVDSQVISSICSREMRHFGYEPDGPIAPSLRHRNRRLRTYIRGLMSRG